MSVLPKRSSQNPGSRRVIRKIFAGAIAVAGAAGLTLATIITLVQGTIAAVSISGLPLRVLVVAADLVIGPALLIGCIYLATHLAVLILGVGNVEFPALPQSDSPDAEAQSGSSKN